VATILVKRKLVDHLKKQGIRNGALFHLDHPFTSINLQIIQQKKYPLIQDGAYLCFDYVES